MKTKAVRLYGEKDLRLETLDESAVEALALLAELGIAPRPAAGEPLEAGLDVELFSQFALPGETFEDAMQTLDFVDRCGVAIRGNSNAQQMQLYFGSAIAAAPQISPALTIPWPLSRSRPERR